MGGQAHPRDFKKVSLPKKKKKKLSILKKLFQFRCICVATKQRIGMVIPFQLGSEEISHPHSKTIHNEVFG